MQRAAQEEGKGKKTGGKKRVQLQVKERTSELKKGWESQGKVKGQIG